MENMTIEELEKKALEKEKSYRKTSSGFACKTCGESILAVYVTFAIWDGPFRMSGSGKVESQVFPYCPKCEERPSIHGIPTTIR